MRKTNLRGCAIAEEVGMGCRRYGVWLEWADLGGVARDVVEWGGVGVGERRFGRVGWGGVGQSRVATLEEDDVVLESDGVV